MRNFFLLMCFTFIFAGGVQAANYDDPVEGILKGVHGDTITVEIPSKVSKSAESNDLANGVLMFQLNSNTGYRNFHQLSELKEGDRVQVDYTEDPNGKMKRPVAEIITKVDSVVEPVSTTTVITTAPSVVVEPSAAVIYPEPTDNTTVTTTTTTTTVNSAE